MFKDIKKLPIASWMKVKQGEVKIERYWDPQVSINTESYEDIKESIRNTFDDSIKKQLISDRPLGVFLSGGMDSTAVLGSVRENRKDKIKTFSVGFKDSTDEEKFNSDFNLARETSKHYNTDHIELMISANDIKDNLSSIVHHLDEPNSNPTAGAIFLLSQLTKKEVAVVLGGDGGDELFGGYPRYYYSALISFYQNQPNVIQKLGSTFLSIAGNKSALDKLSLPANEKRVLSFLAQKQNLLSRAIQTDKLSPQASQLFMEDRFFSQDAGDADFENKFMDTDRQSWLVDESLMRTDKMTMAFGLEARVPILDKRLVELAKSIPSKHKLNIFKSTPNSFQGKTIWRDAIDSYLPNHVKNQKKRGWFTPMAKWIRTDLKDLVSDTLSENNLNSEYFNTKEVQKILDDHITKKQYNLSIIWAIFMWQLWYDQYIKNSK